VNQRIPYVERLREELVSTIAAKQTRSGAWNRWLASRRWAPAAVAGAAVVVAAVVVLGVVGPLRGAPALAITQEDEWATVRLLDPDAGAEAMEQELEAAGIDGNVEEAPVSPSLVGRWLAASWPDGPPEDVPAEVGGGTAQGWSSADVGGKTLRLPVDGVHQADGVGHVTLWLGRPAEPDEPYWASGSAFAEGEPLHCSGVEGMRAQEAEQVVTRLGYEVSWFTAVDISDGPESPGVETNPVKRAPQGTVSGAEAASRTKVRLFVVPDDEQEAPWRSQIDLLEGTDALDVDLERAKETGEVSEFGPSLIRNLVSPDVRCDR
jgi:hypothetical protein